MKTATGRPPRLAPRAWILLILLLAAALRLAALEDMAPDVTGVPPGMTHDEADHGLTAWSIVNGARALYFPIGYGREPLYDYATAVVMRATGPTILAARLTSVYFGLLLIAAVYAWARRAFGAPAALLAAAGLAAGFWPLMTARQALRSSALPALFSLAVVFFWEGVFRPQRGGGAQERGSRGAGAQGRNSAPLLPRSPAPLLLLLAGVLLGLTFYTYLPARVMWLALPLLAGYLWLRPGAAGRPAWRGPLLALLAAAAVAAPLLLYLAANPQLEVRVGELSAPLRAATGGDFGPLWANATASLRLFTIEGDAAWRYNLPGRPFLPGPLGWLFYVGLVMAGWLAVAGPRAAARLRLPAAAAPGAFLALVWLALGMAPVLVTGPGLSTTQAIGAQPAVFLLPALPLGAAWGWATARGRRWAAAAALAGLLLVAALVATTARDYFSRWTNAPDVRVQYETTMVTALRALDARGGAAAVSTITPGPFHTPAVGLLTLRNPTVRPRWFDGRESLLLPAEAEATLLIPGFTPVPAALQPYLAAATLVDELPMRPHDLDRPVRVYSLVEPAAVAAALARMKTADDGRQTAQFGEHATWLGYDLSAATARPGDTITLVTAWRLERPLPGAALFAHVDGPAGPLAQADSLGAPGESWQAGDTLLQLHVISLPGDAAPGTYPLTAGVYTRPDGARLPLAGGGDQLTLTTITILPADSDG